MGSTRDYVGLLSDKEPQSELDGRQGTQPLDVNADGHAGCDRDDRVLTTVTNAHRRTTLPEHDESTTRPLDVGTRFEQSKLLGQSTCERQRVASASGDDGVDEPTSTCGLDNRFRVEPNGIRQREGAHD